MEMLNKLDVKPVVERHYPRGNGRLSCYVRKSNFRSPASHVWPLATHPCRGGNLLQMVLAVALAIVTEEVFTIECATRLLVHAYIEKALSIPPFGYYHQSVPTGDRTLVGDPSIIIHCYG